MLVLEIMDKERIMIEKAVQEGEVIGETMVVKKLDIGGWTRNTVILCWEWNIEMGK